jgi:hypothetical protein
MLPLIAVAGERLQRSAGILGLGGTVKRPPVRSGTNLILAGLGPAGWRLIDDPGTAREAWAMHIRAEPWHAALTLSKIGQDQGHDWDLLLTTIWTIEDARVFAKVCILPQLTPDSSLSTAEAERWMMERIEHEIRDALAKYSVEQLRDPNSVLAQDWETRFRVWAVETGLRIRVTRQELYSASAAAAEERRQQQELDNRVRADRQAMRQRELDELRYESVYEEQKQQISLDTALSAAQREAQLDELERARQSRKDQFEQHQLLAIQAIELMRTQHETQLANLQQRAHDERLQQQREMQAQFEERRRLARIEEASRLKQLRAKGEQLRNQVQLSRAELDARTAENEHLQEEARKEALRREAEFALRMKESELRIKNLEAQLQEPANRAQAASEATQTLLQGITQLLTDLLGRDDRKSHQAAEMFTNVYGTNPQVMQSFGADMTRQTLVDQWTSKARQDGHAVQLLKSDFTTRDLGLMTADTLRVGSSLALAVTSQRAGYVTLLNLGTSGKFWRLTPGPLCSVDCSRIAAGSHYEVPGPKLFPYQYALRENGPAGWEHIVAIVSDQPLFSQTAYSANDGKIIEVSRETLLQVNAKLQQSPDSWTAAVLSFFVE